MRLVWIVAAVLCVCVLGVEAQEEVTLTVVAHDSFAYSESVMDAFTDETGIRVEVVRLGDAGSLVNQSILSRENPLGDVLFGVDNTFLSRALNADLFIPYESSRLMVVDDAFLADDQFRVTPIDFGDVCLNYDVAYFEENSLPIPESLVDLTDPVYSGLLTVQNPATSSPGLAFLITTIRAFGEEGEYTYLDFWADLIANDVYIAEDWTDAYYGQFSGAGGSEGTRPLVVSYASSPPAEVFFAETPPDTAPTSSVIASGTCFRQVEFAGILRATDQLAESQQLIDFLLSREFQEDMPLNMFVFPVVSDAELPEVFTEYALVPEDPVIVDAELIDESRERWLETWIQSILR